MRKLSSLNLPWPVDWTEHFGTARPLIVEIGFGQGQYLLHLVETHPDAHIIGLEIANQCLLKAERAIERRNLKNLRVIHTTAETALHHLFEPASLSAIHINFPDPWFKSDHKHRRLLKRQTLDAMVSRMQPGADFYLATDILEYAQMSADLLAATPGLTNKLTTPWAESLPGRIVTKYEAKARAEGRDCYYFAYQRNAQPAPQVAVIKELEMPHVILHSPQSFTEMLANFQRSEHRLDDTYINLMYAYQSVKAVLFEVYVKEPTIDQHVALLLMQRPTDNEYTIRLSALGTPRPTAGIHQAVRILGEWLAGLHPEAQILEMKARP